VPRVQLARVFMALSLMACSLRSDAKKKAPTPRPRGAGALQCGMSDLTQKYHLEIPLRKTAQEY
jgi:hypothetical protein